MFIRFIVLGLWIFLCYFVFLIFLFKNKWIVLGYLFIVYCKDVNGFDSFGLVIVYKFIIGIFSVVVIWMGLLFGLMSVL